jgi:hypothetical protein
MASVSSCTPSPTAPKSLALRKASLPCAVVSYQYLLSGACVGERVSECEVEPGGGGGGGTDGEDKPFVGCMRALAGEC